MSDKSHFGTAIQWRSFQEGIQEIMNDHKPGIILIEKTWCPTCKKVGKRYQEDAEFLELSKQFVMICCIDDEEPNYDEFRPDGSYYPRMFFVDQNGNIDYSYVNAPDGQMYRYFFGKVDVCKDLMKKMLGNATTAAPTN